MVHATRSDFAGWIRTTWLPYVERVPEPVHQDFIEDLIDHYLLLYPADIHGRIYIGMIRLEVEASKISPL